MPIRMTTQQVPAQKLPPPMLPPPPRPKGGRKLDITGWTLVAWSKSLVPDVMRVIRPL